MPAETYREDSQRVKKFRNFLMRQPRPVACRVQTEDGEHDYQIVAETNFANLAEQLDSLEPLKVTVFDEKGTPIRAWRKDDGAPAGGRPSMIELPEGIKGDPSAAMLLHFGNLIARAYEHSTEVAFDRLATLLETVMDDQRERNERLKQMEDLYFSAMHANADLKAAAMQEGQDPADFQQELLQTFLANKDAAGGKRRPRVVEQTPEDDEAAQ